ncbi:ribonuclease H family protein [Ancylobacter terrae]|uniref:ribonuclease H family protein n=1 Tax=Ancylobacter sp. sgz301288 TaxID=3342077 RepID=UPI0038582EB9
MSADIVAYADGSSLGNPGPGGWAVIVQYPDGSRRTFSGGESHSTNNRQEITAATQALLALPAGIPALVFCDSEIVVKGVNDWRPSWEARGWKNAQRKPVVNRDLWEKLFAAKDSKPLAALRWTRGHAGNEMNEAVDKLARAEAERRRWGVADEENAR